MNKLAKGALAGVATGLLVVGLTQIASATEPSAATAPKARSHAPDDLPNPLGDKQRAMRKEALAREIKGKAKVETKGKSKVIKLDDGRYVERALQRDDAVFSILVDFGDQTDPNAGGTAGPKNNNIPQPDRNWDGNATDDNSTYWASDFNAEHYKKMFFGAKDSFADFYKKQSGGAFTVHGDVSDWVTVPFNEARYGSNNVAQTDGYWNFVGDTATSWYDAQKAAGKSDAEIKEYLATFDQWDRYDFDGDGNFNESDGYIDHFEAIHAGEGEEAGGGAEGADAIWSHRWYAFSDGMGRNGPAGNLQGGVQIGDTGMWIGDYTTEPENGGLGVFAHEFGHDLGLPDEYDTAGGDNGTGFWTLMSGGSWLNKGFDSIGTTPGYMNAWDKYQLGWLDYEVVPYGGAKTTVDLGIAERVSADRPQAMVVTLPDQKIVTEYNTPFAGDYEWWGGSADGLNTTLTRTLDLTGATSASISAKAWYEIEEDFDFLYAEVSEDGGATWAPVNGGGLTGSSDGQWTDLNVDLSAYAGKTVDFRFRYATDGGVHFAGPFLDNISLTVDGSTVWTDDAETADDAWTADGFTRMTGTTTEFKSRFYIAENRQYVDYDDTLRTGPYNFGDPDRANWVERFPYQNGLLIWYVNYAFEDNNTSAHPGGGLVLPVDSHPAPIVFSDGFLLGNRRQPFDATFGLEWTNAITLHHNGVELNVPSHAPAPVFNDSNPNKYWSADNPQGSVKVAGSGTVIRVVSQDNNGEVLHVEVSFK